MVLTVSYCQNIFPNSYKNFSGLLELTQKLLVLELLNLSIVSGVSSFHLMKLKYVLLWFVICGNNVLSVRCSRKTLSTFPHSLL